MDPLEELVFLRQMVQRLNSALAQHQSTDAENLLQANSVDPPAPWLTDPRLLSPLLTEYDQHLSHLVSQVTKIKEENHERKVKLEAISNDNDRLNRELKALLQQQIQEAEAADSSPTTRDNDLLENLQRQLDLATNEKDEAVRMCRETMHQLDKLRHQRQTESASVKSKLRSFDETRSLNEQLQEANLNLQMAAESVRNENQALEGALHQQESELQNYRDQLKFAKNENIDIRKELEESKNRMKEMQIKIQALDDDNAEKHQRELVNQNTTEQLRLAVTDAESKLAQALQERTSALSDLDALKLDIAALEKANKEMEQKEMDAMMQIRENAQMLENALLARDSALEREKAKQGEVDSIRVAMETLVDEVATRVKSEVDKVKVQYNNNIQRMMDEMQSMELDMSNLRSEADRAKRAKRAVEEEFESWQRQQKEDQGHRRLEELHVRMLVAERARDDALVTVQSLEDKIKRMKIENANEISSWVSKQESLDRNVKQLKREIDESQHERMLLLETVNRQKNETQKFETQANEARLECSKETARMKSTLEREQKQLKTRIRSLEDSNRNSIQHLHKMLADQQRMTAKWKEECQSINSKYEGKVSELHSQLGRAKRRCNDLTNRIQQMKQQHMEVSERVPDLSETNRKLRARLHETEYRLISATEKLGELQGRKTALTLRDLES